VSDWDAKLKQIDRQLESLSDDQLLATPKDATAPQRDARAAQRATTSTFGVLARLTLAVGLGVAVLFWPYDTRCGLGLLGYLAAVLAVAGAGVWSAVWTWRHRSGRGHVLALGLAVWGVTLALVEVLPRVGYAAADPARSAWACQ
jgi:hypothetical protein